jgi:signal transduction histidine kinase
MNRVRDRILAAAVVLVLLALAGLLVFLVLDAQRAGIETREDARLEQVQQLANDLDLRVQQAYGSFALTAGAPGAWTMRPGDPTDAAKLQPTSPQATSGSLLLDPDATIVNGSLLIDQSSIGGTYESAGLADVLGGEPGILPVRQGLTTPHPVLTIAVPVRSAEGDVVGAYLAEVTVTADSPFSEEIAQLRAGRTGEFNIVDSGGRIVASTDEAELAARTDIRPAALRSGIHHDEGRVTASAPIPAADWTVVFAQDDDEFQGDITRPLQAAVGAIALLVLIGGLASVVALTRRLRAAHEEQRRLAEISVAREEFASIVSHELRTPVAGLLGFLQTTIDHWDSMHDEDRRRAVGRALENAERLQHLSTDVLDTSALETGNVELQPELVDLRPFVQDVAVSITSAYPEHAVHVAGDDRVLVICDPTRLRQVLGNLLENAVKNSPSESPVDLTVARAADAVRVTVRDHGSGIAPADRERIFEKYTRAGVGLTRGTGLGLFLARQIVQAHGGRIWVDDTEGAGTTIVFTLPLREGDRG